MANKNLNARLQMRHDTSANWEAVKDTCIPLAGEFCVTMDGEYKGRFKIGDGVSTWGALEYATGDETMLAQSVMFENDLVFTENFGKYKVSGGKVTIPAKDKSLYAVLLDAYSEDKNPTTNQPVVSVSSSTAKAYEVGTSVSPQWSGSFNAGSYTYGPATGITAKSWSVTDTDSHSATTNSGSFDSFTVGDSTNYSVSATATYDAGAVPVTNTGNAYAAGQIAAGSKSGTSSAVTGYREVFYGTVTSKGEITSDVIRGLTKLGAKHSNGRAIDILCPVGAMRVILAFPASCRDLQSIKDRNGLNAEAITSFATTQIDVEGANGYTAAAYKVYYLDFANANDTVNHYDATL